MQWWILNCDWVSGRPLSLPQPELTVVADASLLGWGGHLGKVEIRSIWSLMEAQHHINLLELLAIRLVLEAFLPSKGRQVQVFTDNTTAM